MAGMLQYPVNVNDMGGEVNTWMKFTLFRKKDALSSKLEKIIFLYMPESLQNNTQTTWEQSSVGQLSRSYHEKGVDGMNTSVLYDLMKDSALKAVHEFGKQLGGSGYEYAQGQIVNPYIAMTFKGLGFRQFELQFKFTPLAESDTPVIKEIINSFRQASLPTLKDNMFTYPMEIEVEYFGDGAEWLFKYKRCVLTGVDVNYTGAGFYAKMKNGSPAQIIMNLRFSENQLVTREDIDFGKESC